MTPHLPSGQTFHYTRAASSESQNEDAYAVIDDVTVVVDGAGLPASMRAGCTHTVAWFARSIANAFQQSLATRSSDMKDALRAAIRHVADSHSTTCDLDAGSPSATVAAWRRTEDDLEYLVLCDASVLLIGHDGKITPMTDRRLEMLQHVTSQRLLSEQPDQPQAAIAHAARTQIETLRNRPGGFWCVNNDPDAAHEALTGTVPVSELAGVVACSDGASRAYDLVQSHTLKQFAASSLDGRLADVAVGIRRAEETQARRLEQQGLKIHDDFTIVSAVYA